MLRDVLVNSLLGEQRFPFLEERCVHNWHRKATCRRCADACPEDAITLGQRGIEIDWRKCTSCGRCIPACPSEALCPLTRPLPKTSSVQVACFHQQGLVGVKGRLLLAGLWALDLSLLLILAAKGVSRISIQGCEKCGMSGKTLEEHCEKLLERLQGVTIRVIESRQGRELSRREFFSVLSREGHSRSIKLAGDVTAAVRERLAPAAKRSPAVPERRRMLIGLGPPHLEALLTGMSASDRCDGCMMCARFCPTGALREEAEEGLALGFSPEKCVQCDLCLDICPKNALGYKPLDPPGSPQDIVLFSTTSAKCVSCGREALGGEFCLQCAKEHRIISRIGG